MISEPTKHVIEELILEKTTPLIEANLVDELVELIALMVLEIEDDDPTG